MSNECWICRYSGGHHGDDCYTQAEAGPPRANARLYYNRGYDDGRAGRPMKMARGEPYFEYYSRGYVNGEIALETAENEHDSRLDA